MRFTIKLKLAIAFGSLLMLLLGTAGYAINSLSTLNETMEETLNGPVTRLELVQTINIAQLQEIRQQKNLIVASTPGEIQATPASSMSSSRGKGFALDISMGGPDADDAHFRERA